MLYLQSHFLRPVTSDSDVWIKRSNRKQPGVRGNKREETLSGKA